MAGDTIKCAKCGSENPKTNKFCDSCGSKLVPKEAVKKEATAGKTEKKEVRVQGKEILSYAGVPEQGPAVTAAFTLNWELLAWVIIMIITLVSRFADLGVKPLHHDESMHAFYSWKLFMGNGYSYNPMLHGPFHYHINALMYFLFGACDYTTRVAPAMFGVIGVFLVYFYRPYLGKTGTIVTALIMAISPTFMYQSRFIREDIFMAVDTIALVVGLFRYFNSRKPSWLYLAAVALAFSWATKEATYISIAIFGSFLFFRWIWEYQFRNNPEKIEEEGYVYRTVNYWLKEGKWVFLTALAVFVGVHALLYFNKEPGQNFFQNLKGIPDGYIWALTYWWGQHSVARGSQPIYFYLLLTPFYEMLSVFFMLVASGYYIYKPEKRTFFNIFCIYWWAMSILIYSWAGEKMPWLAIHPLVPMVILAGKFIGEMIENKQWGLRRQIGTAVFVLLALASIHGAIYVCFYGEGASPNESLVYVQTSTDVTKVVKNVDKIARKLKSLKWDSQQFRTYSQYDIEMSIEDYCSWPFAWYFRDYKKIAYPPRMIPADDVGKKAIIFSGIEEANVGHDEAVKKLLEKDYVYYRYKLREWWAPDENKWWSANLSDKMNMLWKRFMYRDVWNDLGSYDFVVYVRKDIDQYWDR